MNWIILSLTLSCLSLNVFCADSTWLLCENGAAVFNTVEHRNAEGAGRETSIQMLIGVNLLQGLLVYSNSEGIDSGTVSLTGPAKSDLNFTGKMTLNYSEDVVTVTGNLNEAGLLVPLKATMKCKEMHANTFLD